MGARELTHAISVVEYCISESNYKKSLVINRESLDIICAPSVGLEQVAEFDKIFTEVR